MSKNATPHKGPPKKDFASPLNSRLEDMKNNLHRLMFNTGLDQTLLDQTEEPLKEEINPYRADPAL